MSSPSTFYAAGLSSKCRFHVVTYFVRQGAEKSYVFPLMVPDSK